MKYQTKKEADVLPPKNEKELAIDIGTEIFRARVSKCLTQKQLAKRMKTLQPSIARAERGNTLPSISFLFRISKALKMSIIPPNFK